MPDLNLNSMACTSPKNRILTAKDYGAVGLKADTGDQQMLL